MGDCVNNDGAARDCGGPSIILYDTSGTPRLSLDRESSSGHRNFKVYAWNCPEQSRLNGFFGVIRENEAAKQLKYTLYDGTNASRVSDFEPFALANGVWPRIPLYSLNGQIISSIQNLRKRFVRLH